MACESLLLPPGYQWYHHTTYGQALMIILIQKTPTVWSFQPAWLANLFWAGWHRGEVFLILPLFFLHEKLNALEASAVSEVREGLVENDDGFDLVLVDQKEKVRVSLRRGKEIERKVTRTWQVTELVKANLQSAWPGNNWEVSHFRSSTKKASTITPLLPGPPSQWTPLEGSSSPARASSPTGSTPVFSSATRDVTDLAVSAFWVITAPVSQIINLVVNNLFVNTKDNIKSVAGMF